MGELTKLLCPHTSAPLCTSTGLRRLRASLPGSRLVPCWPLPSISASARQRCARLQVPHQMPLSHPCQRQHPSRLLHRWTPVCERFCRHHKCTPVRAEVSPCHAASEMLVLSLAPPVSCTLAAHVASMMQSCLSRRAQELSVTRATQACSRWVENKTAADSSKA